jgi:hypothetical protein
MRSDMSKVIVERPRSGGPGTYPRARLRDAWSSLDEAPLIESMGGRYQSKYLNENLQPLVRFLRSNLGRPWNKVRSEIAASLSCDSGRDVLVENDLGWWGPKGPLVSRGSYWTFYVCPRTGLLRLAPPLRKQKAVAPDPDRRVLGNDRELRRIDGVWYEVSVAPIPATGVGVAERATLTRAMREDPLWASGRCAASKRQLGTREIRRLGLREP